jgi:two-component system chemotaxis sensor kinase CheA
MGNLRISCIGELIINRSRFGNLEKKMVTEFNLPELSRELRESNLATDRVIDDLHTAIMDTRMVAVGTVFSRYPRVVRDLAKIKKKAIQIKMSGEETEIDKTIIEQIYDPLLHLIRNSADHGVEMPDVRSASGKPPEGTVNLRAYHEGGTVVIEVEDDGKGLDAELIRQKAVKNKIRTEEEVKAMSDMEVYNLIFLPGFSTAEVVTDISGRGVGMDVVKTNIEKLRGKIYITTEKGKGTKITLKLPLTMAIIDALMVRVGEELFALPLLSINGIARINSSEIQRLQGQEAVMLHGKPVGVVRLSNVLNISCNAESGKVYIVTIATKNDQETGGEIGFIVDSVKEKEKIVVKALDDSVTDTEGVSGVTILGDGRVALILDPIELVNMTLGKCA